MSATATKTPKPAGVPAAVFTRILDEGYGPGAWYGSDLRAAVGDVKKATAFTRPAKGRHNIAEVAVHHAYHAGQVTAKLTGEAAATFPLEGEDWFELKDESRLTWKEIAATLDAAQQRLSQAVSEIASGARISPLGEAERFDLIIGITGHAAYHAGQIQLIKKLIGA
jgi:DinB superfamily